MEELEDVKQYLPRDAEVEDLRYEASDIIIYTSSKEFFLDHSDTVKQIVSELKKRVEVRPSSKLFMDPEKAEEKLYDTVEDSAGVQNVIFQPSLGKMIIRAENPGEVVGDHGKGLDTIRKATLWAPQVERVPAIESKIVDRARELTVEDPEFRKDFLHEVGEDIRLDKSAGDEWVRVSSLGGFRQVGRSCVLVQTEESNVLLDAGINPAAEPGTQENFPHLDAPELNLQDLDAVVLSHAHMDHCLTPDTPVTLTDGSRKPISKVEEGDRLKTVNWKTGEIEEGECTGKKEVQDDEYLEIETDYNNIKASGDHRFFTLENLEVKQVEASELSEGDLIPRSSVERDDSRRELEEPEYRERLSLSPEVKKELKQLRERQGLIQKEVSEAIGKGQNFVQQLENKYSGVYRSNLVSLLEYYRQDTGDFFEKYSIQETSFPDITDRELGSFVGYFYGDGHRDGNRLRITDKSQECLENYRDIVEQLFGYSGEIKSHTDSSKEAYQLEINNLGIARFLEQNFEGITDKGREACIPPEVTRGGREFVKGFIAGLFDSEGDIDNFIRIAQADSDTRKQIQNLLSTVGIKASRSPEDRRVAISRSEAINRFAETIDPYHPKKKEKLERLTGVTGETQEVLPITSQDLHNILKEAGMSGRISGSPDYSEMPAAIVDWYRRDSESLATRGTVEKLVESLEKRKEELERVDTTEIKDARRTISLTRQEVIQRTSATQSQLQLVEDRGKEVEVESEVEGYLSEKIQEARRRTEQNIQKLNRILEMDVEWHEITEINRRDNEYGYLVDIRVSPHHNFIANDQVVHNCGMIPYLYKMGYDGPLYCTQPTRDLMIMLTLDYIGIAQSETADAPYDSSAIKKAVKRTITPDYGEVTDITPDMRLTLKNSGHILGSALTHIHVGEGLHNILYTGDYNYDQSEMLRPADTNFKRVETLITESTYGGKGDEQQPREEAQKKFLSKVKQTLNKGGKVIVPVFAVGRSQEILGLLSDELDRNYFDYNVYLDGMIKDANALHTAYPEFLSEKVQNKVFSDDENSPFTHDQLHAIGSHSEREKVFGDGPCVILTTSGMITGGPVMSYLKKLAPSEKNAMIFVGYQASGTLGNKIQSGRSTVSIDGQRVDINLDVSTVSGFSAHSDRQQIINFCKNLRSSPNEVLCNHGEESKCFSLASSLHKVLHIDTEAPQNMDVTRVH